MTDQNQINTVDSMLPIPQLFAFGFTACTCHVCWSCCGTDYGGTGDEFTCGGLDSPYYSRLVYLWYRDLNPNIRLR